MAPKRSLEDAAALAEWSQMNVAELKTELEARGLTKGGKKAELVARLQQADNENSSTTENGRPVNTDYEGMKVQQLKDELDRRGLLKGGTKAELSARLQADDNGDADIPKVKRKKQSSPDVEIEGELARDLVECKSQNRDTGEKRLRPFVPEPDDAYKSKLKKIRKERMFMLDRKMGRDESGNACENFDIAGSTGNIYQAQIGRSPKCTCMDARIRGQKCKHINYALIVILKAPAHMCYQLAFMSDELNSIFANAPVTRVPVVERSHDHDQEDETIYNGKRKPIDGECPICVDDLASGEELVWCKAACGQNFHKECFEKWRGSRSGQQVTCIYCRTKWQEEDARPEPPPAPGSLASLKAVAPKKGSYQNIGHHAMYQNKTGGPSGSAS